MATEKAVSLERETPDAVESTVSSIKRMLKIGTVFAAVGYLLIGMALMLELTQFYPLVENFFRTFTENSIAGGGAELPRSAAASEQLTSIHQFPSMLLWLKVGGIGHILVGIFVTLAAIIRALALMPHRLSYEMERTQG
jgi:hypothetical protein